MDIVFVSSTLGHGTSFGGGRLSLALLEVLLELKPGRVWSISVGRAPGPADQHVLGTKSRLETAWYNLLGYSAMLTGRASREILHVIGETRPATIWLDSSLFGRLARSIKRRFPQVRVVAFFHNIEFDMQRMRARRESPFYAIACVSDWLNERLTLRYADICIMLTASDSARAMALYGRPADLVLPVTLPDSASTSASRRSVGLNERPYILFVGALFGPNLEAARFIANELAPVLPQGLRAIIVGSGFDAHVTELSRENVEVFGTVDDLSPFYAGASLVLAPVFSGGGMKVKVAEALMHGKRVLASRFASIGYEQSVRSGSIVVCDSPRDYLAVFAGLPESAKSSARHDYEAYYSAEVGRRFIQTVLEGLGTAPERSGS